MFTGLSAFPLTPVSEQDIKEYELIGLVEHLAEAGVDSIGVLGSTGNYAYLSHAERARVVKLSVENAAGVPIIAGIGALRTREVLANAESAQEAGASGVLLAPVSYQKLTDDEVFELYTTVCKSLSVPLCVYDNPGTTHFEFSDELHGRIAHLPQVRSIKIPPVNSDIQAATERVARLSDWFTILKSLQRYKLMRKKKRRRVKLCRQKFYAMPRKLYPPLMPIFIFAWVTGWQKKLPAVFTWYMSS